MRRGLLLWACCPRLVQDLGVSGLGLFGLPRPFPRASCVSSTMSAAKRSSSKTNSLEGGIGIRVWGFTLLAPGTEESVSPHRFMEQLPKWLELGVGVNFKQHGGGLGFGSLFGPRL